MGNRSHVIFHDQHGYSPAVYLHWNGGPESVYAFLDELRVRGGWHDSRYACARFTQLVGELFDGDGQGFLSLGVTNGPKSDSVDALTPYDHGDNGVFLVAWNGDGYDVRRFFCLDADYGEASPERVLSEEATARSHAYSKDFAAFYDTLRGRRAELLEAE